MTLTLAACANRERQVLAIDLAFQPPTTCKARVHGDDVDMNNGIAMARLLKPYDRRKTSVVLNYDGETPYRCIGQAIYLLQAQRFKRLGFISEPPR